MMKLHSNLMEVFDLVSKKIICFVSALILGLSPFLSLGNVVYASENSPGTLPTVDMDRINTFEEDTNNENYAKDISDLSTAELADFKLAARLEAENSGLQTEDEKEAYYQALINLFDPNSETYGDLELTTIELTKELNSTDGFSMYSRAASRGWISVGFAGSAFNLGVNLATGGVASAGVKALIRKYGSQRAIDLISRRIVGIAVTWGIKQVTGINIITGAVASVIKTALDPGTAIAKAIDARDIIPNNGYLELW